MKQFIFTLFFIVSLSSLLKAQSDYRLATDTALNSTAFNFPIDSVKPVDLVDYLVKWFKVKNSDKKRTNRKVRFSLFPSTSNISGGKTTFTSFNISFLLGDRAKTNASTIYFYPYIGFGGQYGFQLMPNIWLHNNSWNFTGEYFILNYPQNTWGLGGNTPDEDETLIDYKHIRIHQNATKGIFPHFSAGIGYSLDQHYDISVESTDLSSNVAEYFPKGQTSSTSSGLTIPILYDSRQNSNNPQQGLLTCFTYSFYNTLLGSDNNWQSIFFDVRKYFPLPGKRSNILAFRGYYWTIVNGKVPYLDLPANRWEPSSGQASRGIRQNRYRSNAMLDFESEYRFGITTNGLWGGVVFASVLSASEYDTQQFMYWHPAAGAGVRMKFNKYSNTNIALDFGFSKGFASVYLFIGEAF
jgi:outer membrane protein assembly factor BamA